MRSRGRMIHIVAACSAGWMIDAFDFFTVVFTLHAIAATFHVGLTTVTWAITLPLATRVIGALTLGRLADRFGRKPLLLANMVMFIVVELGTSLAPTLAAFLTLRALFGLVMGAEWGVGTTLVMESVLPAWRGVVSGLLQSGYSLGYLLSAVVYGTSFNTLGWRGMFLVGVIPAFAVAVARAFMPESEVWASRKHGVVAGSLRVGMRGHWRLLIFAVLFMSAASTFAHGTQDLFPTMLRIERGMSLGTVAAVAVIYNIGAVIGCLCGGAASQVIGRRRQIVIATGAALVLLPFWMLASGHEGTALTAFLMQFLVQCTYGVLPAYLNELAPSGLRSTFAGFVYQIGNLLTAANATLQSALAVSLGHRLSLALGASVGVGLVAFCLLAWLGPEADRREKLAADTP